MRPVLGSERGSADAARSLAVKLLGGSKNVTLQVVPPARSTLVDRLRVRCEMGEGGMNPMVSDAQAGQWGR